MERFIRARASAPILVMALLAGAGWLRWLPILWEYQRAAEEHTSSGDACAGFLDCPTRYLDGRSSTGWDVLADLRAFGTADGLSLRD